jgi:hypothetical protein
MALIMRKKNSFLSFILASCLLVSRIQGASVLVRQDEYRVNIEIGGKPFTTYFFGPQTAKAYMMPLQTAGGLVISRPFPVANDVSAGNPKDSSFEPHQRPLYFAHGNIDGLSFWGEAAFERYYDDHSQQAYGHMTDPKLEEAQSGSQSGRVKVSFALADPNGRIIGGETQSFTFSGEAHQRIIDCDFMLHATHGPITLGDSKEGTFGIRLGAELSEPLGHMLNSRGDEGEKNIWGKTADWVNYYGVVSGSKVGIVVFDHPTSFRHPTTWHARGYGLLAANPFGIREFTNDPAKDGSWTIPEGSSLEFKYRVLIYDGDMSRTEIDSAYKQYTSEHR